MEHPRGGVVKERCDLGSRPVVKLPEYEQQGEGIRTCTGPGADGYCNSGGGDHGGLHDLRRAAFKHLGVWGVGGARGGAVERQPIRQVSVQPAAADRLFRRFGMERPLALAVVLSIGTTLAYGIGPGFAVLLIARILWGLCYSILRLGGT